MRPLLICGHFTYNLLHDLVAGTEGAVLLEVIHVLKKHFSHSEYNMLKSTIIPRSGVLSPYENHPVFFLQNMSIIIIAIPVMEFLCQ